MIRTLIVASPLLVPVSVPAYAISGNQLHRTCTSDHPSDDHMCFGYIMGLWHGILSGGYYATYFAGVEMVDPETYFQGVFGACVPEETTNGQIVAIMKKFLSESPERRHVESRFLLVEALGEAFPCEVAE